MQRVIRTYPDTYIQAKRDLQNALSEGYEVVMCNPVCLNGKDSALEYIVEKKEKSDE